MVINKQAKHDAKQLFNLCHLNGLLDDVRVRQVVQYLLDADHRNRHAVLARFLRLIKLDRAQHTANVESAIPLLQELKASTTARLARLYGPGLTTSFTLRPSLIGGMRIQVGSDVYDGSVQGKLAALQESF
jgi:F-type H+-transporting ATPase subunit delta